MSEQISTPSLSPRCGGNHRNCGECLNAKTDERLHEQAEVLARCENYTLRIDLPGWARQERGAKPMSARSFVTRQRDHRRDRGKSESNDMVNDVPETEQELKTCIRASQVTGYPLYFPSLVSENKKSSVSRPALSLHTYPRCPCAFSPLLRIENRN